jgi:hypothetical protein
MRKIGSQSQYKNYLNTIFPESRIKDTLFHGTMASENLLNTGFDLKYGGSVNRSNTGNSFYFGTNFENSLDNYAFRPELIDVAKRLKTVEDYFSGKVPVSNYIFDQIAEVKKSLQTLDDRIQTLDLKKNS